MVTIICSRCRKSFIGRDEFEAHTCKGLRPLADLSTELLRRVVMEEITEAEAWKIQDTL